MLPAANTTLTSLFTKQVRNTIAATTTVFGTFAIQNTMPRRKFILWIPSMTQI
jgi:hypothetical protein